MDKTLEESLNIIPLEEAIKRFEQAFPNNHIHKLQLEYEGPFLKYEFVGSDGVNRNTYEFNASTGDVIKERQKALKEKQKNPQRLEKKKLDTENLLALTEINQIALDAAPVDKPFQWELDRSKDRTIWKVELANDRGSEIHEVKIDAQDGTITQIKLKG